MTEHADDTIFAIATPPGSGGVGVIRISGPACTAIAKALLGRVPALRQAEFARFLAEDGSAIDSGIVLLFAAPASFTGEDVLELHGHGGPVVLQMLSQRLLQLGARAARPGEFSERAFLNDKLDLSQAEAIADLIASGTEASARAAQRSLEGALSRRVTALQQALTRLRVFIEAALDFPDEEIDFIAESDIDQQLAALQAGLQALLAEARQGQVLRDGITVAIIGQPNAGKSSLLNALTGRDAAIVTDLPGTTRDVVRETISLQGLPVHIADTAGLREAGDVVEAEGIRRARQALALADLVLLVLDLGAELAPQLALQAEVPAGVPCIRVYNKADLDTAEPPPDTGSQVVVSALHGQGLDELIAQLRQQAGLHDGAEGSFSARTRHVAALQRTAAHLEQGAEQLRVYQSAETLAEELRLAQRELGEITGEFLPDDLLGAIFSSFCIGK
jgi:tRNA modification GTPase